ncbi:MAG TPA: UDP-N-acetylmuramoyl-L-alanyl-D-glutamate--2,6-diaminopimelate ligase [Anaerolineales bacterium]|nr:UDP-N-acetylmuramoyl-L-alanyl-D-glutamate--2,6-diaminopimelate ligase [Anaerolineales bacterium]
MEIIISLDSLLEMIPLSLEKKLIPNFMITKITADSRKVISGTLFVACPGDTFDGHDFIDQAVSAGAVAVVGEKEIDDCSVPYIRVDNSRQKLAHLSSAFYGFPSRRLVMIGVTGTDGKTTTTNLIYKILEAAGYKAGMISTVNAVIGDQVLDTGFHVTTPDSPDVQKYLSMMVDAGITHVVLETTSHGWSQFRVDACDFDIGVITNVTHEHLDQHGSYQNYLAAKGRLLQSLSNSKEKNLALRKLAVLNADDESYDYLKNITQVSSTSYGMEHSADYAIKDIEVDASGLRFNIFHRGRLIIGISTNLIGSYNAMNCTAAFSAAVQGLGIDPSIAARGISSLDQIPGRMERIDCGQDFTALVDFAHTPNALKNALLTARQITSGRIIAVFGSAGLRDRQKRRMMAEISSSLADLSVFTAEDPRTESLGSILDEMAVGAIEKGGQKGVNFWCIPDRRDAIRKGIQISSRGDLLIVCGKGHEQSMCFGTTEYAWDDRTALQAALSELMGIEGPDMPFLPVVEE